VARGCRSRQAVFVIQQLRQKPSTLEEGIEKLDMAADEIDRLLPAINNAQAALTDDSLKPEGRIETAHGAPSFADR
jgi:hypothetical protein